MSTDQLETQTEVQDTEETILEMNDVSVAFPSGRGQARPLTDVNFEINRGELLGVIGESGSGKSMLAAAILNAVPDPGVISGEIMFYPEDGDPVEITDLDDTGLRQVRWESIAKVPQGAMSSFNPTQDIKKHFEETLKAHNHDEREGIERARELLRDVNLDPDDVFEAFPHELSGGQKQRALVALSLLLDPEVLVMDEPTAALDLLMQRRIINHLYDIRDKYDITIIFISHDLSMVTGFAERVAIMYAFEIIEDCGSEELLRDASHPYTRALLKSTPNLQNEPGDIESVAGESPDPVNIPSGCSYHPRCPLADDRCEIEDPALIDIEDGHKAACFYWDQAEAEIPLSFGGGSQ